jgi:hypothetical protein
MIPHREKLSVVGSAFRVMAKTNPKIANDLNAAAIALEKAEKRMDALEIIVRKLVELAEISVTNFEAQATRNDWPRNELQELLR